MARLACMAIFAILSACAATKAGKPDRGYAGTVQKVYPVTLQGRDLPGIRLLGKVGGVLGPKLRKSSETNQYVVRTRTGQIMVQSDEELSVGDCVEVIPESDTAYGPAFRYGQARISKSDRCTS